MAVSCSKIELEQEQRQMGLDKNRLWKEAAWFFKQKIFVIALAITAVGSYGYAVIQPGLGIDDTATELYFVDGLAVVMGRWVIFLLNKILNMAKFAPFLVDFAGVLLLMASAVLLCVLLRRIWGDRITLWGYVIFACVFLSNPIISEVFIYYIHNGLGIGYVLTALSFLLFTDMLERKGRKKIPFLIGQMLLIWAAAGCYESFLILYILGVIVILFLRGMAGKDKLRAGYIFGNLGLAAAAVVGCIVLRQVTIALVTAVFGLQDVVGLMGQRNLTEMLVLFQGREGLDNLLMLVKRFWLVYHLNAVVYLPITGYEFATFCIGIGSLVLAVKRKNLWYPVLFIGMLVTPFLLTIAEARLTFYRSCQYLPFFTAMGVLLAYMAFTGGKKGRLLRPAAALLAFVLIFNQAESMNRSFYIDYKKYESTREILTRVAYEVEREYGTGTPIVFTGHYETPHELVADFYVDYSSWQYRYLAAVTDLVDEHLKEKYFSPYGYSFIGEGSFPFIQWGFDAFDDTNREMIHFLELHGHSFQTVTDRELLEEACAMGDSMPKWPAEGSVRQEQGYILIHM